MIAGDVSITENLERLKLQRKHYMTMIGDI
jgi:hypothetical protein